MSSGGLRRPDVRELAAIFAGGAVGALLRVGAGRDGAARRPRAGRGSTFAVNIARRVRCSATSSPGCRSACRCRPTGGRCSGPGSAARCTTFSTMQVELLEMLDAHRYGLAAGYAAREHRAGYAAISPGDRARPPGEDASHERARLDRRSRRSAGSGALLRFLVDGLVASRVGREFPFGHARRSTSAARSLLGLLAGLGVHRRRAAARRHRDDRLLHDVLDLDAREPPARRGRRAAAALGNIVAEPRRWGSGPRRWAALIGAHL